MSYQAQEMQDTPELGVEAFWSRPMYPTLPSHELLACFDPACDRFFEDWDGFFEHWIVHQDSCPFVPCHVKFKNKFNFRRHWKRVHTDKSSLPDADVMYCNKCGKVFLREESSNLEGHEVACINSRTRTPRKLTRNSFIPFNPNIDRPDVSTHGEQVLPSSIEHTGVDDDPFLPHIYRTPPGRHGAYQHGSGQNELNITTETTRLLQGGSRDGNEAMEIHGYSIGRLLVSTQDAMPRQWPVTPDSSFDGQAQQRHSEGPRSKGAREPVNSRERRRTRSLRQSGSGSLSAKRPKQLSRPGLDQEWPQRDDVLGSSRSSIELTGGSNQSTERLLFAARDGEHMPSGPDILDVRMSLRMHSWNSMLILNH